MKTHFKNVLFLTDFSETARHAQRYAVAFAERSRGTLHVCHAVDAAYISYFAMYGEGVVVDPNIDRLHETSHEELKAIASAAGAHGVEVKAHLLDGAVVSETLRLADQVNGDLIVLGTHGRTGFEKLILGSTCEAIVRKSLVPVLSVKRNEHDFVSENGPIALQRVLVPIDLSEFSEQAVPYAAALCGEFDAELILLHVVDSRVSYSEFVPNVGPVDLQLVYARAESVLQGLAKGLTGIRTSVEVVTGVPHRAIAERVAAGEVDLLVMGTHGHTGLLHAVMGSTAEKMVRMSRCPVLTVRPEQRAKSTERAGGLERSPAPAT